MLVWHLACKRQGTAATKGRSEVKGSTRKVYKQKGTGRARRGMIRTPIMKGGGRTFAKKPKDWSYPLPKKVRRLALKSALSAKFAHNKIIIVDDLKYTPELRSSSSNKPQEELNESDYKYTRPLSKSLMKNGWENSLILDDAMENRQLTLGVRNSKYFGLSTKYDVNVYDILKHDKIIIHRSSIPHLEMRSDAHAEIEPIHKKL